ncbi:MAG: HPr kinase/phosphatase C-terminal domain-containing protein [Rhizobiaceae bacterium]|nr:HPr kinase/phosphatase C-terminal domain-containing protein [Rhizobiaceae bacterium]
MPQNLHASAVVVGDRGVIVTGPSGSGKTMLCMALLDFGAQSGVPVHMLGDDQLFLKSHAGRLVATAPESITGLVEIRGFRPSRIAAERSAVVDLLIRLVPPQEAPRLSDGGFETLAGVTIPALQLPQRNTPQAVLAIRARLDFPPFLPLRTEKSTR